MNRLLLSSALINASSHDGYLTMLYLNTKLMLKVCVELYAECHFGRRLLGVECRAPGV